MDRYFDRQGQPISMEEWGRKLALDSEKRVAETTLPDGRWVSTVWLGLNHRWDDGPPLIFETMVFDKVDSVSTENEEIQERYSTLAEAEAGHAMVVAQCIEEYTDRVGKFRFRRVLEEPDGQEIR